MHSHRTTILIAVILSLALVASGCGDDDTSADATDAASSDTADTSDASETSDTEASSDTTDTSVTADTTDASTTVDADVDASLLLNCAGTIDDDVPAFFADYFRCVDISMDGGGGVLLNPGTTVQSGALLTIQTAGCSSP